MDKKKKPHKGPTILIVIGSLLSLSPVFGFAITVFTMIGSFKTISQNNSGDAETLANEINMSLMATQISFLLLPIGILTAVAGIIWLVIKKNREEKQ
ncbi:MAG: MotA/TolQ/ExbB proton channel family protein [Kiritimatiellae bacterium]|nr:MotA/TolQ/ExbB proton channel family protein [Kiritimatiellia bacterium]